ncbi:4426_t:CDS:2 [Gigaspora margarita]|uniref:4426_t:CDS:1 n=1 Tax=Gigaspora margarita TaxID=4874 RepID=A0ABM8VVQ8_GIGMA|nr:4426_t:CDS:2 [Gigaspora margarita]
MVAKNWIKFSEFSNSGQADFQVVDEFFEKIYEPGDATNYLKNHLIKDSESNREFWNKRFKLDRNILSSHQKRFDVLEYVNSKNIWLHYKNAALEKNNADLKSRNSAFEQSNADLKSRNSALKQDNAELKSRNAVLGENNSDLITKLMVSEKELETVKESNVNLKIKLTKTEDEREAFKTKLEIRTARTTRKIEERRKC